MIDMAPGLEALRLGKWMDACLAGQTLKSENTFDLLVLSGLLV